MPVLNFELEDGQSPVSFSLNNADTERFVNFMAECTGYKKALEEIGALAEEGKLEYYSVCEIIEKAVNPEFEEA